MLKRLPVCLLLLTISGLTALTQTSSAEAMASSSTPESEELTFELARRSNPSPYRGVGRRVILS